MRIDRVAVVGYLLGRRLNQAVFALIGALSIVFRDVMDEFKLQDVGIIAFNKFNVRAAFVVKGFFTHIGGDVSNPVGN